MSAIDRPWLRGAALVLGLLWCAGCGGCDSPSGPSVQSGNGQSSSATGAQSTSATALPKASAVVALRFDGSDRKLTLQGDQHLALHEQLPAAGRDPQKWRGLHATAAQKRELALLQYGDSYGKTHDAKLYLGEDGQPVIGLFRRVRPDMPAHVKAKLAKPQVSLVGVNAIEIRTTEVPLREDGRAGLKVVLGGKPTSLSSAQITALKPMGAAGAKQAGQRRWAKRGWRLIDVLKLAAPQPGALAQGVDVHGDDSARISLSQAQLNGQELRTLLRYNRRGVLVLELWRPEDKRPSKRLRSVRKVVIKPLTR